MALASILVVDDNPDLVALMGKMLEPFGQVRFATSGMRAIEQIRQPPPDLVLLDAEMPEMNGYAVCRMMRADPEMSCIPVIFVGSRRGGFHSQAGQRTHPAGACADTTAPQAARGRTAAQRHDG